MPRPSKPNTPFSTKLVTGENFEISTSGFQNQLSASEIPRVVTILTQYLHAVKKYLVEDQGIKPCLKACKALVPSTTLIPRVTNPVVRCRSVEVILLVARD